MQFFATLRFSFWTIYEIIEKISKYNLKEFCIHSSERKDCIYNFLRTKINKSKEWSKTQHILGWNIY